MVFEKIRKILADQLEIEENKINLESNLVDDLNADSLDIVELIMDVEQEYDITIPDEDLPSVVTVKDIVSYIESQIK